LKQYLKDVFKLLLRPFENWDLTLVYTARYFRSLAYKMDNIPELIEQTVRYIDEFMSQLPIEEKQTKKEE
jgi:hypothetical protein